MQAVEIPLTVDSRLDMIRLVFFGDLHLGNAQVDERLIEKMASSLALEDTYCVDLGDACEFINLRDKRFSVDSLAGWARDAGLGDLAEAQIDRYIAIFEPHAAKFLARLRGNHESQIHRRWERDVYAAINRRMKLPAERALGFSGFIRLRIRRLMLTGTVANTWTVTIFVHHGAGGGQLAGAKALRLERLVMAYEADIYAKGHTHAKLALPKRRVGLTGRKRLRITDKKVITLNVGAFMRGELGGYAEESELYPQGLGPVEVWLYPDTREMRVMT